jgi:hypothetical protein
MTRKAIALIVAVAAAMLLAGTFESAEARKGGWRGGAKFHGGFHRGFHRGFRVGKFHGGGFHRRHHHRHKFHGFRRHFYVGVPLYYGAYYGYGYGPNCYWLKKKARRTGSPYWWDRYYDCREGYGY